MEISISRLDYKNPSKNGGLPVLPSISSLNDISDMGEVQGVGITFESKEEAETFISKFPKSYRPRLGTLCGIDNGKGGYMSKPYASISFGTFWMNKTTGELNESGISKRVKFIKKLKELI